MACLFKLRTRAGDPVIHHDKSGAGLKNLRIQAGDPAIHPGYSKTHPEKPGIPPRNAGIQHKNSRKQVDDPVTRFKYCRTWFEKTLKQDDDSRTPHENNGTRNKKRVATHENLLTRPEKPVFRCIPADSPAESGTTLEISPARLDIQVFRQKRPEDIPNTRDTLPKHKKKLSIPNMLPLYHSMK
jgi:hypothetical protein